VIVAAAFVVLGAVVVVVVIVLAYARGAPTLDGRARHFVAVI
jgi:hypothetical protein